MLSEAKHLSRKSAPAPGHPTAGEFNAPAFRAALSRWYRKSGRALPWRKTRDPYAILVSEFMLQQTQVATVLPYYKRWLPRFPNFENVARAAEEEILHAWQGLGYYARARHLHAAAKIVAKKFYGRLPQTIEEIETLPGVGRYTASAIASFAFNQAVPTVDANIARVIARLFNFRDAIDRSVGREALWEKAALLLGTRGARDHNSALMDLGSLICVARNPKCDLCPVGKFCCAIDPHLLPRKRSAPRLVRITEEHGFTLSRGRVLLEKSRARWRGMWILPRLRTPPKKKRALHISHFPFTHHRITLAVFSQSSRRRIKNSSQGWFPINALDSIPLPSPHRRALGAITARTLAEQSPGIHRSSSSIHQLGCSKTAKAAGNPLDR